MLQLWRGSAPSGAAVVRACGTECGLQWHWGHSTRPGAPLLASSPSVWLTGSRALVAEEVPHPVSGLPRGEPSLPAVLSWEAEVPQMSVPAAPALACRSALKPSGQGGPQRRG